MPLQFSVKLSELNPEPQSVIEILIANIWKDVLHINKVGVNDNFFELGGLVFIHTSYMYISLQKTKLNEIAIFFYLFIWNSILFIV